MGGYGGLGDDLLIEILTRLPLKSFFRNKCVSKAWDGLISDEYVRKRLPLIVSGVFYQPNSSLKKDPTYGCTSHDGGFEDTDLSFFPFQSSSTLIDCCNGLLLFLSSLPRKLYVVSPTTKRWACLPKPSKRSLLSVLAFDPYYSPCFKVVSFTGWRAEGSEVEVFWSQTGKWTEHEVQWGLDTNTMSATMRYIDGVLFILAPPNQVVGIDLESMNCRRIELPEATKREGCVGKSGGYLHYTTNDGNKLRIWMLKEYSGSFKWVLKHSVSVTPSSASSLPGQFNFLAFHPELEVVYLWLPGKLVAYDLNEKRMEEVCELGSEKEKEKAYMIQVWLFPFSRFMTDCLASVDW